MTMSFDLNAYLDELRPLINVDCGTYQTAGIAEVAAIMAAKYQAMGWSTKEIDCGKAGIGIEARNKPDAEHIDLMLVGHLDTVFPAGTAAARPLSVDETNAYGPGVSDMKGGQLNMVYALRSLDKAVLDKLSICVCMNPDEETGSGDSSEWLKSVALMARQVLVAEPARVDGSLVKARKGVAQYKLTFKGKAAHAGNEPQNGYSAISEMAHWILAINALTDFETGTTLNVGIVNGGTGSNIVPDHASAIVDVRFWDNDEYTKVDQRIQALAKKAFIAGVSTVIEREAYKPAMATSKKSEALMAIVEQTGKELGIEIKWQAVGGGSDANLTASLGIPTIDGLGPIGGGLHSDAEWLQLDSIEPRIKLLAGIIEKLAQ